MAKTNVTITIPPDLKRKAAVLAARRGTTVSGLVAELLKDSVERTTDRPLTAAEFLAQVEAAPPPRKRRVSRTAATKRKRSA